MACKQHVYAVTRYKCKSELYIADLTLDVNSSIYPLSVSGRYTMRLSMTLLPDVSLQKDEYDAVRCTLCYCFCLALYSCFGKL